MAKQKENAVDETYTVGKKDLVAKVSDKTGQLQSEVSEVLESLLETITSELAKGNNIAIRNFGSFNVIEAKGKIGRNPKKPSEMVKIPPRAIVKFKSGKSMKERVARILPMIQQGR